MDELVYKITKHCEERYAARILGKDNANDINKFIIENKDKIKVDVNKMIEYGELIHSGKTVSKDNKGNIINVYLKDTWIILVDSKSCNVITLYKVDLGCGEEFNKEYISKMMDKLNSKKEEMASIQEEVEEDTVVYKDAINDAQTQINEYKSMIKNLESMCEGYQALIDNNRVKVSQANIEVSTIVNTLIGKKEF